MKNYKAIVLGATGNVGGGIVQLLIDSAACDHAIVVTRRNTNQFTHPKLTEVVVDMDHLERDLAHHAIGVDIAFVAFGFGKGSANMPEDEVRKVEVLYPQAFCRAAKNGGARVCALMTAAGADPESRMKYVRIIGEKEKAIEALGFEFLGIYRPGVIVGNSNTPAVLGTVMPLFDWAIPAKYRSVHKNDLARAMVVRSEQALQALDGGMHLAPQVRVWSGGDLRHGG